MQVSPNKFGKLLALFTAWYLGLGLVLTLVDYFVAELPNVMGFIIAMAAAMHPQYEFIKSNRRLMTGGEKTSFALKAAAICVVVSAVLFAVAFFALGGAPLIPEIGDLAGNMGPGAILLILGLLVVAFALSWVAVFLGLTIGAKANLKRVEEG